MIAPVVAAGIVLAVLVAPPHGAFDDGINNVPYNYVHPPPFLATTNLPPRSGVKLLRFQHGASPPDVAATFDAQASLSFLKGAWPYRSGQTAIRIKIDPLRTYHALPKGGTTEGTTDGNVYGFHASLVPSGAPITTLRTRVLLTLEYPHTPYVMLVLDHGKWRPLCDQNTLIMTPATASCYERTLYPAVALLYHPLHGVGTPAATPQPRPSPTATPAPSNSNTGLLAGLIAVVVITIGAAAALVVLLIRRREPTAGP